MRTAPESSYQEAARLIKGGRRTTAFTGAGISVESGIPPFRGPDGLWSRYDPQVLDIEFFHAHPGRSWVAIREIFYSSFLAARMSDVLLLIGTTGEVMPAGMIPQAAKETGARILEINTEESQYTRQITDVFLKAKATAAMVRLLELLGIRLPDGI